MKRKGKISWVLWSTLLFLTVFLGSQEPPTFKKGEILTGVTCAANPEEKYSLYLPSGFNENQKSPIVFAFEPAARTRLPLELFKTAADKFGYIMVCPENAQNGPWDPVFKAMKAVWKDVSHRFLLDPARVYTTGFSGGARAAALFSRVASVPVAGIIACGAGLPQGVAAREVNPSYYYGIVGLEDFNYKEFVKLAILLERDGVSHTLYVVDGPHNWPETAALTRAIEWMEVLAIKKKTRSLDSELINSAYNRVLEYGKNLVAEGKIFYAVRHYRNGADHFNGLVDTTAIEEEGKTLEESRAYKVFIEKEKHRNRREIDLISRFAYVFSLIRNSPINSLNLKKVLADMRIMEIIKESEKGDDPYDRFMARRLLTELLIKGPREGGLVLGKKEYKRAIIFFEIVSRAGTQNYFNILNLARAYARDGQEKKAMKNLIWAVHMAMTYDGGKGLKDLESDKDLESLKKEKAFQEIIQDLKK